MTPEKFYKKYLRIALLPLLALLLCIGARADGDIPDVSGQTLVVDDLLSNRWTAKENISALVLVKNVTEPYLSLEAALTAGNAAGIARAFDPSLDLYYNRTLRTAVEITVAKRTNVPFYAELVLCSGDTVEKIKVPVLSGKKTALSFDISAVQNRGAVDTMELCFYEAGDSPTTQSFTCKIYKIEAAGSIDRQLSERFMAESFVPAGAEITYSQTELTLNVSQNDAAVEGLVTVKPAGEFTNAIRIVLANNTKSTAMRVFYAYSAADGFSDDRSVTVDIKRSAEFGAYLVPVQNAAGIKKLKIVFTGNAKGTIVLSSISAVCAYTDKFDKIGAISACTVSEDGKYIIIKGTVKNEHVNAYRDCTLALYELSSFEELGDIFKRTTLPTSTHSMSTKFEFKLPLSEGNYSAILSKYAVVLYKGGAVLQPLVLVDGPRYVSGAARLAPNISAKSPANAFKGIQTAYLAGAQEAGAGRVVIDVELNRLLNSQSSGYLHRISGKYIYFNAAYVDALDREIRAYTAGNTEVLLNLVITGGHDKITYVDTLPDVKYYALNVSKLEGELYAGAVVDFLALRYNGSEGMAIGGFILGKRIDEAGEYNCMGAGVRLDDYAKNYVRALRLVYTTAQSRNPNLRVYVPLGDSWRRDVLYPNLTDPYDATLLLESLTALISAEGSFEWRLLCHSARNAFGLYEGESFDKSNPTNSAATGYIGTDSIDTLFGLISELDEKYHAAPGALLYFWQPNIDGTGTYLAPLYAYNYYKLLATPGVEGFVVSFSVYGSQSGDGHSFLALKELIKYIDTAASAETAKNYLSAFGIAGWEELVHGFHADRTALRKLTQTGLSTEPPPDIRGSYDYWDFSAAGNSQGWIQGEHCDALAVSAAGPGEKALVCALNGGASEYREFMGIFHVYPYPENLALTPWLTFDLRAVCTDGSENKLEVVVVIGSGADKIEAVAIVDSGERVVLTMNLDAFDAKKTAEYIKIWVRGAGTGLENATLELYKITGHSQNYDSDSLAKAIADARKKASDGGLSTAGNRLFWIGLLGGAVLISTISFLVLSKRKKPAGEKE